MLAGCCLLGLWVGWLDVVGLMVELLLLGVCLGCCLCGCRWALEVGERVLLLCI